MENRGDNNKNARARLLELSRQTSGKSPSTEDFYRLLVSMDKTLKAIQIGQQEIKESIAQMAADQIKLHQDLQIVLCNVASDFK